MCCADMVGCVSCRRGCFAAHAVLAWWAVCPAGGWGACCAGMVPCASCRGMLCWHGGLCVLQDGMLCCACCAGMAVCHDAVRAVLAWGGDVSCRRGCSAAHAVLAWLYALQGGAVRAVLAWCTVRPAGGDAVPDVLASRSYSQQQLQESGKRGLISIAQRVMAERKAGKGRQCKQCKRKE